MHTGGPADAVVERAGSLSSWSSLIQERFVPLQIAPHGSSNLRGTVRWRQIGHLQAATVRSVPQTFERTRRQVAAATEDLLAIGVIERGTGYLEQDGRTCVVADGGFALYDTARPFTWRVAGDWDMHVYTWPRARLPLPQGELERLTAFAVPRSSAVGSLVTPMLHRLTDHETPALSAHTAVRVADEVVELALIAASEHRGADDHEREPHGTLFGQVQEFVEDNLGDPRLGAEHIARELFVSARTLHRVFARRDLTVAGWIKTRRLEACRRALCSPSWQHVPISQVAAHHGFSNASFFSREFTARFGLPPRGFRQRDEA